MVVNFCLCLYSSESQQEVSKSRKNKHKENVPAPFEMKPRGEIDTDPRLKMKALLPIKHSEGLEYRWEEKRQVEEDEEESKNKEGWYTVHLYLCRFITLSPRV